MLISVCILVLFSGNAKAMSQEEGVKKSRAISDPAFDLFSKKELLCTILLNVRVTPFFNPLMNVLVVDIKGQNDQRGYPQQD